MWYLLTLHPVTTALVIANTVAATTNLLCLLLYVRFKRRQNTKWPRSMKELLLRTSWILLSWSFCLNETEDEKDIVHRINRESHAFLCNFGDTLHSEWAKIALENMRFPTQITSFSVFLLLSKPPGFFFFSCRSCKSKQSHWINYKMLLVLTISM